MPIGSPVRGVSYSPDGRWIAGGHADGTVRVWDLASGTLIRVLEGHGSWVNSVAFSPDGGILASGSFEQTWLLSLASNKKIKILERRGGSVSSTAFSPDGRTLASGSDDNMVRLWNPTNGVLLGTMEGHGDRVLSVAFSPNGRTLASGSEDTTVRLWDPASGQPIGLMLAAKDLWIYCRIAPSGDRCWRYDDGTLAPERDAQGRLSPLPLPPRNQPPRLEIRIDPSQPAAIRVGDGELAELKVQVRNTGAEPVYWLRLNPKEASQAPFLFHPPPRIVKLDPGAEATLAAKVSCAAAYQDPTPAESTLDLVLDMDQGEPIPIRVPVRGLVPEPAVVAGPEKPSDLNTVTLRLANRGGQALEKVRVSARVSTPQGADRVLDSIELTSLPAGGESPLSFAVPDDLEVGEGSRLTLTIDDRTYPMHSWRLADLPIVIAVRPGLAEAGMLPPTPVLAAFALLFTIGLWYSRQRNHPLAQRLATEPTALPRLGLAELPRARRLLAVTRRLKGVLATNGIRRDWLTHALAFDRSPPEERVAWLARRLGAQWQRQPGLGGGANLARFDLTLPESFPLNLVGGICPVVLPPADWSEAEILEGLAGLGEQVCLAIGATPAQRAALSKRCRSPETWWVGPDDAELSALLLAPEPLDALSRLIARYVKVARVSPYQTSSGVRREGGFFGRAQVLSHIQHRAPTNYLLVGGRQLGKSSLLLALERRYASDPVVDCRYCSVGFDPIAAALGRALGLPADGDLQTALRALAPADPDRRGGRLRGAGRRRCARRTLRLPERLPLLERRGALSLHPGRVLEPVPQREPGIPLADQELCRGPDARRAGA
jgi:hypothetical protein